MPSRPKVIDRDKGWKAMLAAVDSMAGGSVVKVGVLADDAKGGLHVPGADLTVAEIAAIQEFGTEDEHVPARPFLRPTFDRERENLVRISIRGILQIFDGKMSVGQVLGLMGAHLAAETKKTITATPLPGIAPANAPSTAKAKGGEPSTVRTLVDTGRMLSAVTWSVVLGAFSRGLSRK